MTWWHSKRDREIAPQCTRRPICMHMHRSRLDVCPSFVNFLMFTSGARRGGKRENLTDIVIATVCQNANLFLARIRMGFSGQIAAKLVGLSITHTACNCNCRDGAARDVACPIGAANVNGKWFG